MIKKIQKYLLLNNPIIWNIRLIPMIIILIGVHLFLFLISYLSSEIDIESSYYYSRSPLNNNGLLYVGSVLIAILILIGWLVFYSRNNAFKTFYPRKTSQLYLEWFLIFVITTGIALLPLSLAWGTVIRWRTTATVEECVKNIDLLNKVKVLIPNDEDDYTYNPKSDKPIPLEQGTVLDMNKINLDLYAFDYNMNGDIVIKGYKGPSLLFYSNYNYRYNYDLDEKDKETHKNILQVKNWLKNEQKDSILAVMKAFNELQLKNDLPINLTPEQWIKRIYNPPYYSVNPSNMISSDYEGHYYNNYSRLYDASKDMYYVINSTRDTIAFGNNDETIAYSSYQYPPYLQQRKLDAAYLQILDSHDDSESLSGLLLFCMCTSLWTSMFIFSFRATKGKSWLIALVISGVTIFTSSLFTAILGSIGDSSDVISFIPIFWISSCIILLILIISKVKSKTNKGWSMIYNNIFLWLVPTIIPFLYMLYICIYDWSYSNYYAQEFFAKAIFWINIPVVIIAMWFIAGLIRKWKSLPEE